MNPNIKAVLFDLDGTLLDTAQDMGNAANKVLNTHDHPPLSEEQIQENSAYGARGLLKAGFKEGMASKDPAKLKRAFLHHYKHDICGHTRTYEEIPELLTFIIHINMPWGIVTNKPSQLTHQLLTYFPLLSKAHVVVCSDTQPFAKPHSAPLLYAAKNLCIKPNESLFIGDIKNDIISAKSAGMHSGIATWGHVIEKSEIFGWDADHIFKNPNEIQRLLK